MVRLWFCIRVRRSRTTWEMTQAAGWSDCDFASEWGDHVQPERRHRPRNGQIVILHPSEEITYKLRDDTGRGMVRLWFCIRVRRSRTHWEMTQAAGWSDCGFVSSWGDHLPTDILGRYITTSGTMTLTAWWNYIHPQWDHFSLMVQSWSLYINFDNMYLLAVKICNMTVSAYLWNALWVPTCCTEIHPWETFIYLCSSTVQRWLTSWRWPPERQYLPFK
jgi:hypothetical protein